MLKTKGVSFSRRSLSSEWCYRYLLGIPPLDGSNIKIKSPFSIDRTPSFSLFKKEGASDYRWRCFSTGRGEMGSDHIELFIQLQDQKGNKFDRSSAFTFLANEYEIFVKTGLWVETDRKVALNGNAKVVSHELRKWNEDDHSYWYHRYGITTKILEHYNVAAVHRFTMEKLKDGKIETYLFDHPRIYGYFRKNGSLDRFYRPGSKKGKFIKSGGPYVQGSDQIITPQEKLITIKSLKDVMAFHTLDIDGYDLKSPDSESILLPRAVLEEDKKIYKKRYHWMDPDPAGRVAAAKYTAEGMEEIISDLPEKDLSDNIERFGHNFVRIKLLQIL